jgi:hypothetical protein
MFFIWITSTYNCDIEFCVVGFFFGGGGSWSQELYFFHSMLWQNYMPWKKIDFVKKKIDIITHDVNVH